MACGNKLKQVPAPRHVISAQADPTASSPHTDM